MPSYCIHLAVGNLYANKNQIKDKKSFDEGIIAPDFAKDKEKSHYSVNGRDKSNLVDFLAKKVQLSKFLDEHDLNSDYNKGVFLHLVTDYIYFTQFFTPNFINSFENDEFLTTMYYSYDVIKEYVEEKYNVIYPGSLTEIMKAIDEKRKLLGFDKGVTKENILPQERLDKFIQFCSEIDLEKYSKKIKNAKVNTIADEGEFEN